MRRASIPWTVAVGVVSALFACDGSNGGKSDGDNVDRGSSTTGQPGGDCKADSERCIDEFGAPLCRVKSGYDGDELALCPPNGEEDGLLLHYGPKDYEDPDDVKKYLLPAFGEEENCVFVRTTNTRPLYINRYHGRMRPYSHHLIVTIVDQPKPDIPMGEPVRCDQTEAIGSRWLLGSQDPQIDLNIEGLATNHEAPKPGDPEYGLGQLVQPNTVLRIDMHYVNTTDKELLREGWIYLKAVPKEDVVTYVDMLTFFQGAIAIPPNSKGTQTAIARCRVPSDRHIGMVTGHFHQNGTRFSVWHEPQGEAPRLVYETNDWDLPGNAFFSERIENPEVRGGGVWGATSGYLEVKAGDYVNFQCEYDNPTGQTVTLGELGADQMCNLFGFYYPSDGKVWNCRCLGPLCF